MGDTVAFDPAVQLRAAGRRLRPRDDEAERDRRSAVLNRLWDIIESRKGADPEASHSARLMERGRSRVAQKFGEEAIECLIEAVAGRRSELIGESADVLYHLLVVWVDASIRPEEVWEELEHREDVTTADAATPTHGFDAAVARIRAAVAAAQAAPQPFVLTARAENFLHGRPDLADTVRRLVAFAEAGADCLYAPGLPDLDAIRAVVAAVAPKPVNVLAGPGDGLLPLSALAEAGVRRVSVGGALARAAYGTVLRIGEKLRAGALPEALAGITPHADIQALMPRG